MHAGKLVFAQLMEHVPLHAFRRCVAKYPGKYTAYRHKLRVLHVDAEKASLTGCI
jgi:hypothetical protein